jgi:hemolysin III
MLRRGVALFELREYSAGEIYADAAVHAAGILLSLIGIGLLFTMAAPLLDTSTVTALAIYSATLVAMFAFSAAYNLIPHKRWKPMLRRLDQAAIFLKIAGTYTPLAILIGSPQAYLVLAVVWVTAIAGAAAKLIFRPRRDRYSIPLYLGLGWLSVLLIGPLSEMLGAREAWLLIAGGVLYTAGIAFHISDRLKFQNAIWHTFVLFAATCHFTAVASAALAAAM